MRKPYTIRDVARLAGVGVGTVSRVLNDSPLVSEETRRKVLAVIRELNFHPSPVARRLSSGKTLTLGVVIPFFTRPAFVGRLEGIEAAIARSKYDLVLYNVETPDQCAALFDRIPRERRVDGLIIITLHPNDVQAAHFREVGLPVVLADAYHPELVSIRIDDVDGGRQAAQHLVDLGHRRIAFVSDLLDNPFGFGASARRLEGYQAVLAESGLELRPEYLKQGPHGRYTAHRLTEELLAFDEPPTAIFAVSDTQALGVIEAIEQAGLRVPQDISVVGYDDIEVASYVGLTTVQQPMYETGEKSVSALLQLLETDRQPEPVTYTMPVTLIIRDTTAPPLPHAIQSARIANVAAE